MRFRGAAAHGPALLGILLRQAARAAAAEMPEAADQQRRIRPFRHKKRLPPGKADADALLWFPVVFCCLFLAAARSWAVQHRSGNMDLRDCCIIADHAGFVFQILAALHCSGCHFRNRNILETACQVQTILAVPAADHAAPCAGLRLRGCCLLQLLPMCPFLMFEMHNTLPRFCSRHAGKAGLSLVSYLPVSDILAQICRAVCTVFVLPFFAVRRHVSAPHQVLFRNPPRRPQPLYRAPPDKTGAASS